MKVGGIVYGDLRKRCVIFARKVESNLASCSLLMKRLLSLRFVFVFPNSADPDEMPLYHLGLLCLLKYLFACIQNEMGLMRF